MLRQSWLLRWLRMAGPGWPAATDVTVSQAAPSPGEHLLGTIAAGLLAAVPPLPHDPWLYGTAPRPRARPGITGGLGDVIAALLQCGALPPLSPVPGQLATLCARLNLAGHGITAPPARDLPEPWLSVLTHIVHMHATGPACHTACGPDEHSSWPPVWICDSGGRWHATRTSGQSGMNGEIALRLEIGRSGKSAQTRARLPLRWQPL
jgi:hypothetical protein